MRNTLPKSIDIYILIITLNINHVDKIGKLKYQMMKNTWHYYFKDLIEYKYINSRAKK